ncbi:MAG: hypothetical protein WA175_07290 [Candidatus Acidiferrales bacterium]
MPTHTLPPIVTSATQVMVMARARATAMAQAMSQEPAQNRMGTPERAQR